MPYACNCLFVAKGRMTTLTLSLPTSPFCDQRQSANVAYMPLGHVVCFCDVYYPILRRIVRKREIT